MNEIPLPGCTPEPLMGYLKALGVFRLVAEQADDGDPTPTLHWKEGYAWLRSKHTADSLAEFFQTKYRPTPIVGPWGARSGFFPSSSESSAREALETIVEAAKTSPRLRSFADMIEGVRKVLSKLGFSEKAKDDDKLRLMRECRNVLADELIPWLDTAFILTEESRKFPPLLGTGGNEGSGSYVSTFAQAVVKLVVNGEYADGIRTALFGEFGGPLGGLAVGHFDPGALGGPNGTQGVSGGGGVNPWDYVLGIEGSLLFAGAAARRLGTDSKNKAAYPFCVEPVAVGYATESDKEAGEKTRSEIWLPLWDEPVSLGEVSRLFAEGRAQLGRRQAQNAVEFALALSLLGVSRGLTAFVRYAFVMRYGLSYFAAPLGRVPVTPRPAARLLDDPPFREWLDRLRRACREKDKTPARYQSALRGVDRKVFEFANRSGHDDDRKHLVEVLAAIGRAERTFATAGLSWLKDKQYGWKLPPIAKLSPEWLLIATNGPEWRTFRLAAALASVLGEVGSVGPFRIHLEPVLEKVHKRSRWTEWQPTSKSAVWSNRPLVDNLAAVVLRRFMESERAGISGISMRHRLSAPLGDVLWFLTTPAKQRDDDRLEDLLWALVGLDWHHRWFRQKDSWKSLAKIFRQPLASPPPWEFAMLRLITESVGLVTDGGEYRVSRKGESPTLQTTPVPEPFHRLVRGSERLASLSDGVAQARRRLWADQLRFRGMTRPDTDLDPLALVAACAFPLSSFSMTRLVRCVAPEVPSTR